MHLHLKHIKPELAIGNRVILTLNSMYDWGEIVNDRYVVVLHDLASVPAYRPHQVHCEGLIHYNLRSPFPGLLLPRSFQVSPGDYFSIEKQTEAIELMPEASGVPRAIFVVIAKGHIRSLRVCVRVDEPELI